MTRFLWSIVVLMAGFACTGAAYWGLLNVPESNVLALVMSALLVLLVAAAAGVSLAMSIAKGEGMSAGAAARRSASALPFFLLGLAVFGVLWLATTTFDAWWIAHRGEVDALALRYAGFTNTSPLHAAITWTTWLLRWGLGLSVVAGLVAMATLRGAVAPGAGLRLSIAPLPLAATIAGLLLTTQVLWRAAAWRPEDLPPTSVEVYFAGAKLGLLYVLGAIVAATVLAVFRRTARAIHN